MEQLILRRLAEGRSQRAVADAVWISVKAVQLALTGMRRYTVVTTTQTLIRIVIDQLGGLI